MSIKIFACNDLLEIVIVILACLSLQCPTGSTCKLCTETGLRLPYCEYSCSVNNGGCGEESQCSEVATTSSCSPGECCPSVNITCQGKLSSNYIHVCIDYFS